MRGRARTSPIASQSQFNSMQRSWTTASARSRIHRIPPWSHHTHDVLDHAIDGTAADIHVPVHRCRAFHEWDIDVPFPTSDCIALHSNVVLQTAALERRDQSLPLIVVATNRHQLPRPCCRIESTLRRFSSGGRVVNGYSALASRTGRQLRDVRIRYCSAPS